MTFVHEPSKQLQGGELGVGGGALHPRVGCLESGGHSTL